MTIMFQVVFILISWVSFEAKVNALQASGFDRSRREVLIGGVATASVIAFDVEASRADPMNALLPAGSGGLMQPFYDQLPDWTPPKKLATKIGNSRILATSLSPLQQTNPFASQELYYAPFLFGSWNVTTTLQAKKYPFGRDFVPSRSLLEGSPRNRNEKLGDSHTFEMHFFSTLADTASNQVTVDLGLSIPQTKIIADRAFNAMSMSRGYKQLTPVEEVIWDYKSDPTRLTFLFGPGPLAEDMRPLGQRRGEVYLTARQSELSDDGSIFCAAERSRSVTLGPGTVVTADQETITEFRQISKDQVEAISRIAVYLTPNPNSREGVLWQQVGGKAVAFFDYAWTMTRMSEEFVPTNESTILRACVRTPKDNKQCE